MFSGALLLLSLLLSALKLPEGSVLRIWTAILVILLVTLLIKFRPNPEFFIVPDFFKAKYLWLFQLTVPSVILPVILSLVLIFKTFTRIVTTRQVHGNSTQIYIEKLYSRSPRLSFFAAVLLGFSGFIAIPVIAACKWFLRNDLARIQDQWDLSLFFDPGFAYPFFLGVLTLGYLMWFIIEKRRDGFDTRDRTRLFPVLLIFSITFFILLNFGRQDPTFCRDIICIDRLSGKIKWVRHGLTEKAIECSNYNSQASPTPLIDSNYVYAYFGNAGLISADKSGNIRWKNTGLPFKSIHGPGASPLFRKGGIVILASMSERPYLISLDNKSGKEQWKTDLPAISGVGGEYRTPLLYNSDGNEMIIEWSTSRSQIVIYDAKTGKIINKYSTEWAAPEESIATPCIKDSILYLSDCNSVVAYYITKLLSNDSPILWKADLDGRGPGTSSPVLSNGLLFMISDNGLAICLDSETGDILWQKKLKGIYFSSPVSIGRRIYFSNNAGVTTVIESSAKYTQIAENVLPEGIYSTIVPFDRELFIRTKNTLWCIK
jgi:outer membrane protein assembly factor BamB